MRRLQAPRQALLLALLVGLLLFVGLGSFGLLEDNEARFFEISWEMERSGDWLTPRLNFLPHFHKPPGTFWLVGASLRLLGESEWAGRIPVALAALLTLLICWLWSREEDDENVAARTVLVLVTSLEFWLLSRLVLTDMFLAASVNAAFYFAWRCRRRPSWRDCLAFWLALSASAMLKGPVGLAIVVPVLWLTSLVTRPRASWNLRPALGVPLFLALALPWYGLVCLQHEGLVEYFLRFQTAERMLTTVHGRPGAWWFYLPVLLAGFFPWSTGLPLSIRRAWQRGEELDRFLLVWLAYPLVFFSFCGSKLPTYLLPIFPALALLTGRASRSPGALRWLTRTALATLAVLGGAVAVYLALGPAPALRPATPYLAALSGVLMLANLVAWRLRNSLDDNRGFLLPAGGFALGLLLLAGALGPCDGAFSARSLARSLRAEPGAAVVEVADHLHGLPYYLKRRLVQVAYPRETQFDSPASYSRFLFPDLAAYFAARQGSREPTYIVLRRSDYDAYSQPGWSVVEEAGPWRVVRIEAAPEAAPQGSIGAAQSGPVHRDTGLQ